MTFKKDYINYLLYTVVNSPGSEFTENYRLRKLVDNIIAIDDVMKITYIVGKTAGLEMLFKYLLYISDKIDKSQVTIFNLKDNFEYDKINISKICSKIEDYRSDNVQETIKSITEDKTGDAEFSDDKPKDKIKISTDDDAENVTNLVEMEDMDSASDEDNTDDTGLTLIENADTYTGEAEVFELDTISQSVENSDKDIEETPVSDDTGEITADSEENTDEDESGDEESSLEGTELYELEDTESEITINRVNQIDEDTEELTDEDNITTDLPEIEIEVHKPKGSSQDHEHVKEEPITNEAYYKFETKFFEEVKILEILFATVGRDCIQNDAGKQSEKCLQCLTEIIGITSELSNLSRQLSFDLIADIFLTMNIFFTKSISQPDILTGERIKLLDSSLALVNSLIKGEDYLNYDTIVDKIEQLKQDISREQKEETDIVKSEKAESEFEGTGEKPQQAETITETDPAYGRSYEQEHTEFKPVMEKPALKKSQLETANFKLKYLIKEFEKSFTAINNLKGEYSKFDALEKISELNNALRLIAKISAAIKNNDTLKLAEVTYVFLKYVKDYRMDMQEPEIQQIVKYIIFTFKMLLTSRKPEDFNVLVQHLNNPVKIFADS